MPSELVLLADREPDTEKLSTAWAQACPGGAVLEGVGAGFWIFLNGEGDPEATLFRARRIWEAGDAFKTVIGGLGTGRWWMDLTIPFGDTGMGRRIAEMVAAGIDGEIRERG